VGRYVPKLIAGYNTGLELSKKPFLIPDKAYEVLDNAYVWREQTLKKTPHKLIGRLKRVIESQALANTSASVNYSDSITLDDVTGTIVPGSVVLTLAADSIVIKDLAADGTVAITNGGTPALSSGTIDYTTGTITLVFDAPLGVGGATVDYSYHPNLPVMGLRTQEATNINQETLVPFDTKYAYSYLGIGTGFIEKPSTFPTTWQGTNYDFFQTTNYYNSFFATNGTPGCHGYAVTNVATGTPTTITIGAHALSVGDHVQFINTINDDLNGSVREVSVVGATTIEITPAVTSGATGASTGFVLTPKISNGSGDGIRYYNDGSWYNFQPAITPTVALVAANIVLPYRDFMVALYTTESDCASSTETFGNRARWSQNGTPFPLTPDTSAYTYTAQEDAWRQDIPGKGDMLDAPTDEDIVAAGFIRDVLYVAFERSTWRFRYTGNSFLPFEWDRLNIELGCESQFSLLQFDQGVFFIGGRGINFCDGQGVKRIDDEIPDEVFSFHNDNNGPDRIYGIRDYQKKIVYWTFPNADQNKTFPNKVLLYNYENGMWANFQDSWTALGHLQESVDQTWGSDTGLWGDDTTQWDDDSGQSYYERPVAGNQQGYVHAIQDSTGDLQQRYISAISTDSGTINITSPDHNFQVGDIIKIRGCIADPAASAPDVTGLNGNLYQVATGTSDDDFNIYQYVEETGIYVSVTLNSISYFGGGVIELIDDFNITTKNFNPNLQDGVGARIGYTDFYISASGAGRIKVNIYVDGRTSDPVNEPLSINPLSNRVETFTNDLEIESVERTWHTLYDSTEGSFFQYELTYGQRELNDEEIARAPFEMHAMVLWTEKGGRRLS
jgi:hypothetical protein